MDRNREDELEMNIFLETSSSIYEILMHSLQCRRLTIFENLLRRNIEKCPPSINIDYVYAHPLSKTLLDVACCEGLIVFTKLLLELGANPNKLNIAHHRGPIHFVTELGYVDVLRVLLEEPRTNPNLEANRETALHFAVRKNNIECAKVLLDNKASPNIANAKGITPIHIAAVSAQQEMIETLLNFSHLAPDLDNFYDFRKQNSRKLIENKFPHIQLPPKTQKKVDFNILRFYLDANDEVHFLDNLKYIDDFQYQTNDVSRLMIMAASKNFHNAVRELIKRYNNEEIDVNLTESALIAVKCGHYKVLAEFLECKNLKITEEMLLISCQELGVPSSRSSIKQCCRIKCLRMILDKPNINVRCEDDKGNTPLHYAARAECAEIVNLLLRRGSYLGHMNFLGVPPLAHIAPDMLEAYFDECLESNNDCTDDHEIIFNYRCLMPQSIISIYCEEICSNSLLDSNSRENLQLGPEMDVLSYIASNNSLKNLLKHPLLSSYLYLKWHLLRKVLYINCIFYILFYIFLNSYILIKYRPNSSTQDFGANSHINNSTYRSTFVMWAEANVLQYVLAIFLILLTLREILQLISTPLHYIMSFENWVEVILIVLTTSIMTGAGPPVGAVAILLSAWELIILIAQHPRMSTGIEMFKTVSISLISFLLPYAFLILAFAMAFFTLFREGDNPDFPDPGHSLFKTIIMLTGEFEATDIPFVLHPVLSRSVFIIFIFLIAIVLFNLLIGLAVSDTTEILNKSELVGLIARTELISYAERIVIGSRFIKSQKCCNISYLCQIITSTCLAGRILVFPHYLPHAKITIKPYKDNKILICGSDQRASKCVSLLMDSKIVLKAREILSARGKITENEKLISEIQKIHLNMTHLIDLVDSIKNAIANNE